MNKVIIIGRLTKAPELKEAGSGIKYCKITVAVDRGKGKNGEDLGADFVPVTVFGKTAENVYKYCGKGKKIAVDGKIHTDSYEKDGSKYYTTDVMAERVEFLEKSEEKKPSDEDEAARIEAFAKLSEDDIPF